MEIYRVTKESPEWQKKAYDYVRMDAFVLGQNIPVEMEFSHDDPDEEYLAIIIVDDHKPVAGCRLQFPERDGKVYGKIGRVCVTREKQKSGYGKVLLQESEKWISEKGIHHIVINSQDRAEVFYLKNGYIENPDVDPGYYEKHEGEFVPKTAEEKRLQKERIGFTCVLVEKEI